MSFTLGTQIDGAVDHGLDLLFSTGLGTLSNLVAPLIGACVALYAVFIAANYIWSGNTTDLPVGDLMKRIGYLALFTLFAFNITYYQSAVVVPVKNIGPEIAAAFAATGSTHPQIIDQMGAQILDTIKYIWDQTPKMSITNFQLVPMIRAIGTIFIVGLLGGLFMAVSFCYLMIAKLMVSMVLLLGPIFIPMAFFPVTREFFMKWVSQLLNYILLYALFGIAFTMLTNLLQSFVSGTSFSNILVSVATNLKLIFTYLLFIFVMVAIPSLASQLTGGVGLNAQGAITPMMSVMRGVAGAFKGAAGGAAKAGANSIAGAGRNRRLG